MLVASLLLCVGILFFVGFGITVNQLNNLPSRYETQCVFTGQIVSPSDGYRYICENGNFTSSYDAGESPKLVTMYLLCHDDTKINNDENVICGYWELLIQYVLLLVTAFLFTVLAVARWCYNDF